MSDHLSRIYLRARAEGLGAWERLRKTAQREEGDISQYLFMGIMILIVLAIAVALWAFSDEVRRVIDQAIGALRRR